MISELNRIILGRILTPLDPELQALQEELAGSGEGEVHIYNTGFERDITVVKSGEQAEKKKHDCRSEI